MAAKKKPQVNQDHASSKPIVNLNADDSLPQVNLDDAISKPLVNQQDAQVNLDSAISKPLVNQQDAQVNLDDAISKPLVNQQDAQVNLDSEISKPLVNLNADGSLPQVNLDDDLGKPQVNLDDDLGKPQVNLNADGSLPQVNLDGNTSKPQVNLDTENDQTIENIDGLPINLPWLKKGMTTSLNPDQLSIAAIIIANAPEPIENVSQLIKYLMQEKQTSHTKLIQLLGQLSTEHTKANDYERLYTEAEAEKEIFNTKVTELMYENAELKNLIAAQTQIEAQTSDEIQKQAEGEQLENIAKKQTMTGAQYLLSFWGLDY
jgi:hypothetical protein